MGVTPLREWVMQVRARAPVACRFGVDGQDHGDIPAHMMAGFLGGRPATLHVHHAGGSDTYSTGTVSSDRHAMTVLQFADLINAQANPAFYWHKILADINQFHACNGIVDVEPDELGDFLRSHAGSHAWNVTGDQIMREVQVEALTFDEAFVIPDHLAALLEKVVPFHDWYPRVWLDAYDEDEVSGSHLHQLILAQPFHAEIWQQCADPSQLAATLGEDYDLSEFPHIEAGRWAPYLQGLDALEAELVRGDLLELIRLECQRRRCEPVIPTALEQIFGPDAEERRRLSFRGRLQHDMGWRLQCNPAMWHMYVFDHQGSEAAGRPQASGSGKVDHQQFFETALEAIEAFAVAHQSPFAAHFQFARCLAAQARTDAPFDRAIFERICVSNNTPDYLADTTLVDLFAAFGWPARRVLGLAAISAADVFGGMGSWNDQGFDDDEDLDEDLDEDSDADSDDGSDDGEDFDDGERSEFDKVSAQLFCAMNGYLGALLTDEPREKAEAGTAVEMFARRLWRLLPGAD